MIELILGGTHIIMPVVKIMRNNNDKKKEKFFRDEVINKLVKLESEQTRMFNMFADEIRAIQDGPFYTGLTYLEHARNEHRSLDDSEEMLKNALKEFINAFGIQRAKTKNTAFDVHFQGFLQSYISITWLLLGSPNDAKIWIDKSISSLQEGQKLFHNDITNLKREILAIQSEDHEHNRMMNESIMYAGLDFFFGDNSLAIKKQYIPQYSALVEQYSYAQSESCKYLNEMYELSKQVEQELLKLKIEKSKEEVAGKVKGLIGDVTKIANFKKNEKLPAEEPTSILEKNQHIKGLFNKFKK